MRIHAASLHLMEKFYYEIYFLGRSPSKVVREEHHRTIRDFCSEFLSHNWEHEYARGRLGADCQFLPHEISSSGVSSSCKKLTGGDACAIVYNTPSSTRYFCPREHDLHVDTYCITRRKTELNRESEVSYIYSQDMRQNILFFLLRLIMRKLICANKVFIPVSPRFFFYNHLTNITLDRITLTGCIYIMISYTIVRYLTNRKQKGVYF